MNSAETNKLQWKSDTLLAGKQKRPEFARTFWDQSQERNFGTWTPESAAKPKEDLFQNDAAKSAQTDHPTETNVQGQLADPDSDPALVTDQGSSALLPNSSPPARSPEPGTLTVSAELNEQQTRIARQQGYVQGLKDGMAKTLHDLESERAKERDLIQAITKELEGLQNDAFRSFEPLRKLALHIAEQLVRGELSTSGEAVERLIKACVADLSEKENGINVSLNPNDLERVRPLLKNNEPPLLLQPDMSLLPGSVRVRSNDTVIEDLIENRLEGLAHQLLSEPEPWLKNASRLAGAQVEALEPAFAARHKTAIDQDIDDVLEKDLFKPAQNIEEVQAHASAPAPAPDAAPTPSINDGDQAYL